MQLSLTGRNLDVTPHLRQLVTRRMAKLERLLNDSLISAQVVLSVKKFRHRVDITVHTRGEHVLHGTGDGEGWPVSLKAAMDKIAQQAKTVKGKWAERKRLSTRARTVKSGEAGAERGQPVVRRRRYAVRPMTVAAAATKVEDGRESFLVFRNTSTDSINVVYRRQDGRVGLIDADE